MIAHPSPNFGPRRDGLQPHLVVLHYTAMSSADAALERLCDPDYEVSAHYLIGADGTCWHLVDEAQRAWHAGPGSWKGWQDINSRSIGIELDNDGRTPFPEAQMTTLEALLPGIFERWSIPPEGVIGHSDMAPGRKHDPGRFFDWSRLEAAGLAARPCAQDQGGFTATARAAGYTCDVPEDALLAAVRLRLRPDATGPASADDLSALLA